MKLISCLAGSLSVFLLGASALGGTLRTPSEKYPTIQEAINAAQSGDTVQVAPGIYTQSFSIDEKSDITIRGGGRVLLSGSGISAYYCSGLRIQGFRFVGTVGNAIYLYSCNDTVIRGNRMDGVSGSGVYSFYCNGLQVSRNRFSGVSSDGISNNYGNNAVIDGNSVEGSGELGIYNYGSGQSELQGLELLAEAPAGEAVVTRNRVSGFYTGIWCTGSGIVVVGNRLEGFGYAGVYISSSLYSSGALVERNSIRAQPGASYGIYAYAYDSEISGNYIGDNQQSGIWVYGSGNVIEYNEVDGSMGEGGWGVYSQGSDAIVEENTVRNTPNGIYVGNGGNCLVQDNRIFDPSSFGFQISTYSSQIYTNHVVRSTGTAFFVTNCCNTFIRNTADVLEGIGLYDYYSPGSNVYSQNHIEPALFSD